MKKKKVLIIGGAGFLAVFGFILAGFALKTPTNTHIVLAEETETSESESAEGETTVVVVDSTEAVEETTNKFKEIWEGYLLPAILSVNIGSIVATVTSIILAIKNFKNHKGYRVELAGVVELVVALSKQMADYVILLGERNEQVKDLLIALGNAGEVAERQIALIDQEKSSFEELKKAAIALVNLEVELAKHNPEFVRNGLATQVVEIKNQLMKIAK